MQKIFLLTCFSTLFLLLASSCEIYIKLEDNSTLDYVNDKTAPVVLIKNITNKQTVKGIFYIHIEAYDDTVIKELRLYLGNQQIFFTGSIHSVDTNIAVNSQTFTNGEYTLKVYAVDIAGNSTNYNYINICISNDIYFFYPMPYANTISSNKPLVITVSNISPNPKALQVYISTNLYTNILVSPSSTETIYLSDLHTFLPENRYYNLWIIYDGSLYSNLIEFYTDYTPPTFFIPQFPIYCNNLTQFDMKIYITDRSPVNLYIAIDGNITFSNTYTPGSLYIPLKLTNVNTGYHSLEVFTKDIAENVSITQKFTFFFDKWEWVVLDTSSRVIAPFLAMDTRDGTNIAITYSYYGDGFLYMFYNWENSNTMKGYITTSAGEFSDIAVGANDVMCIVNLSSVRLYRYTGSWSGFYITYDDDDSSFYSIDYNESDGNYYASYTTSTSNLFFAIVYPNNSKTSFLIEKTSVPSHSKLITLGNKVYVVYTVIDTDELFLLKVFYTNLVTGESSCRTIFTNMYFPISANRFSVCRGDGVSNDVFIAVLDSLDEDGENNEIKTFWVYNGVVMDAKNVNVNISEPFCSLSVFYDGYSYGVFYVDGDKNLNVARYIGGDFVCTKLFDNVSGESDFIDSIGVASNTYCVFNTHSSSNFSLILLRN